MPREDGLKMRGKEFELEDTDLKFKSVSPSYLKSQNINWKRPHSTPICVRSIFNIVPKKIDSSDVLIHSENKFQF
jgi:hypothetical protein